jgi:hypothetical protein
MGKRCLFQHPSSRRGDNPAAELAAQASQIFRTAFVFFCINAEDSMHIENRKIQYIFRTENVGGSFGSSSQMAAG